RVRKVDKSLTHRGAVRAALGAGGTLVFVTVHPDNQPTGIYRVETEKFTLLADSLPAGGVDLLLDGDLLWVAGSDGQLYRVPVKAGAAKAGRPAFAPAPTMLAPLSGGRLAALAGTEVVILDRKDGKQRQRLELPEAGTSLASDPTGNWLAVGTGKGTVAVFQAEDSGGAEFVPSE